MTGRDDARVLALPPAVVERRPLAALRDVRSHFEPDVTVVTGPERRPRAVARARRVFDEVAHPPLGDGDPIGRRDLDDVAVVTVQRGSILADAATAIETAGREAAFVALVCDDVTTTVRPTALETSLEYGPELAIALEGVDGIVLTAGLPADYDRCWRLDSATGEVLAVEHRPVSPPTEPESGKPPREETRSDERTKNETRSGDETTVRIRGIGAVDGYGEASTVSLVSLSTNGNLDVETLDADAFGLEAVTGVGPKTATRLEERGIETRDALARTPVERLRELPGIGVERARRIGRHATVLETDEPRRLGDATIPGEGGPPPLCLDIETDGLSPTILWQIGVYDPRTDDHRAFLETDDPSDPAPVLESFLEWLLGTHGDRALVTWNGWRFDYRHLTAFFDRHVSHFADEWADVPKFDLYGWAVTDENALLPGRTNRLADVASALGYEEAETGLDGAATAAAYDRFVRTGEPLDWERHRAYCEDDCRALWHVYDRLRETPRPTEPTRDDASGTTGQTALGDF